MSNENQIEDFLRGARDQGFLTERAAGECRKIAVVLMEVDNALPIDEIAVRKGFLSRKEADTVMRATARRRVGPFEVIEKIGAGAVGKVFRARDTRDGTIVAIKLLSDEVKRSDKGERALERFLREARVGQTLNHPNIVRAIESGESAGYTYFSMEFVPGESLESRLARGKLPEKEAFELARQAVRAFEHLSTLHLIHRDIKPGNLMITPDGRVKLCDLGLTKPALREARELGVEEVPLGTAVYVSPEQLTRPDNIDWRADVYSLGVTLYHAVAGQPPFTGETAQEIAKKQREAQPRDPREFTMGLSEGATNVILKMLQKDPVQRHKSLEDLAADMDAVIEGRVPVHTLSSVPVPARQAAPRVHRHEERRKGGGGLAIAAVVVAGGVGAWFAMKGGDADPGVPPAGRGTNATGATTPGDGGSASPEPVIDPEAIGPEAPPPTGKPTTVNEENAKSALAAAMSWWQAHPSDYAEAATRLKFVVDRYPGTEVEKSARASLAEVGTRLAAAARAEIDKRKERADTAEAGGRLADAWNAYQGFPAEFADTPAGRERVAAQARLVDASRKILDAAIASAGRSADVGRFADAKRILAAAAPAALPDTENALRAARDEIETRETFSLAGRDQQRPAFDDMWARALIAAAGGDPTGAVAMIDATRPRIDAWAAEADQLAATIPTIERVPAAARTAWAAMTGEQVKLVVPARTGGFAEGKAAGLAGDKIVVDAGSAGRLTLDLREIAGEDVVRIAAKGMDTHSAADQRLLFLYALGRRQIPAARAQINPLRVAGGAADIAAADVERVERRVRLQLGEVLRRVDAARRQRNTAEARAAIAEAEQMVPGDPSIQVALASLSLDAGSLDEAKRTLDRVAARKDAPPELRLRMGQYWAQKGDVEKARTELRAFCDAAEPGDVLRSEAQSALDELDDRAAKLVADQMRKDANRLFTAKKWGDAEAVYRRILELVPADPEAMFRLGICHTRQNEYFPAYRFLTVFVRANQGHARVSEAQRELKELEKWKTVRPEDRDAARDAAASFDDKKWDEAVAGFGRALIYSPFLDSARLGLGRSLLARGKAVNSRDDLLAAVDALSEYVFLRDDHAEGFLCRAEARAALGDFRGAAPDADKATFLDAADHVAPLVAGDAHFHLGHVDEARHAYAESYKRKPSAPALYGMAMSDERSGDFDQALDELEQLTSGFNLTDVMKRDVADAIRRIKSRAGR